MRAAVLACLLAACLALVAGCGSSSQNTTAGGQRTSAQSTTHFAKTKFVLHAGLAFGAFHRYIYKPYKEGAFAGGLHNLLHHKVATVKAALAAAFAYHEIKLALQDARSSKVLSTLLAPLLALQNKLTAMRQGFLHGNSDASLIQSANGDASTISSDSAQHGQPIQDQATPQLGG